ncbi:uncharacterized protein (DUF1499 family) [Rhizomicrobium palustre]|uniref:Uncharacterized protein (DUF1499 family) n=1 Tax=Rhizomicrobium palustre TaxID=189966 RepID=A0A846MXH8_9PROT|nr:DUF1499 domain-containing protein [Rhizomicrobium palustre]NIK87687.1 uncharacterized protein (DUF1499 family) [Rhizomicrobium palustre]
MRHQPLLARLSFAAFLIGLTIAAVACGGTRAGHWTLDFGIKVLIPGLGFGITGLFLGAAWIWRALAMNNSLGWRLGTIGLIGSAILTGIPANHLWLTYSLPPIHDISTDIGNAPEFVTLKRLRQGAPNPASYDGPTVVTYGGERMTTSVAQKYTWQEIKSLEPLDNRMPQPRLVAKYFWRALNAVNGLGWTVAAFNLKDGRIEATSTSPFFGIVSDIVIRVKPAGSFGARIDIRAKSRVGQSDAGRNAALVKAFLKRESGH